MILVIWLLTLNPQDPPCYEAIETVAPVTLPYDADPEEIEAESTGGTY